MTIVERNKKFKNCITSVKCERSDKWYDDNCLTQKIAFFDIDGVLSVPRYLRDGEYKPGGTSEWWKKVTEESDDVYQYCKVPKCIKEFVNNLRQEKVKLYTLSTEPLESAKRCKKKFLKQNYQEFFPEECQIYVSKDIDKITVLSSFAKENNIDFANIYYLDDTFSLVLQASELGVDAHHISEFL